MASNLQRTHRILNTHRHGQRRRNREQSFPAWIMQVHPATTIPANVPAGYLANLYPNIWLWGPRGDIYMTQLDRIATLLDQQAAGKIDATFEADIEHALANNVAAHHVFNTESLIDSLNQHAATTGLPLPGDEILGWDPRNPTLIPRTDDLANHKLWHTRTHGTMHFEDFLYRFSLLSVHHAFYTSLPDARSILAVDDYRAFCDRWNIPR